MTPETAAPAPHARRWRGWLWLSLLANALLAWWLWRAPPPAPPPPATPVGESVPVGSTFSRIRVPAHYRYHVELAPEWRVTVQPGGGVRVIAPRVRPTLPVAIDTARIEKESRGLWSMFTGPDQLAALEKSITASLATKAASAPMLARQREAARATVAEFVQKWLMTQTDWKPHAGKKVEVLFADEPIDALDATCGGRPGCAAERLNAAGL